MIDDAEWMEQAACRGMDPDLFFPTKDDEPEVAERKTVLALEACSRCPVKEECFYYALDTGTTHGIFGGTTEKER